MTSCRVNDTGGAIYIKWEQSIDEQLNILSGTWETGDTGETGNNSRERERKRQAEVLQISAIRKIKQAKIKGSVEAQSSL